MKSVVRIVLFCVATLLIPSTTCLAAAEFTVQTDNRHVFHERPGACLEYLDDGFTCIQSEPRVATTNTASSNIFADNLSAFEAGASQESEIGLTSMSGTGDVYAGLDAVILYSTQAKSHFDVDFTVTENADVMLTGFLDATWASDVSVKLSDQNGTLFQTTGFDIGPNDEFMYSATLDPNNSYNLMLSAAVAGETDYNEDSWRFNMTIVPEPTAGVLLFGAAGLLLLCRRK